MKKYLTLCFLFLFSGGCANGDYTHYLNIYGIQPPTPKQFTHCFNYGCQTRHIVSMPDKTRTRIKRLFISPSKTPEIERTRISQAIGIFETDIGALTGTKNDKHGTFRIYQDDKETPKNFQQDCIDESTNTTIYLGLLEKMALLQFHTPSFPKTRQPLFSGTNWWHQTATIKEIQTNDLYAVDSWFYDNGAPAVIIPLSDWKKGWRPNKPTSD